MVLQPLHDIGIHPFWTRKEPPPWHPTWCVDIITKLFLEKCIRHYPLGTAKRQFQSVDELLLKIRYSFIPHDQRINNNYYRAIDAVAVTRPMPKSAVNDVSVFIIAVDPVKNPIGPFINRFVSKLLLLSIIIIQNPVLSRAASDCTTWAIPAL